MDEWDELHNVLEWPWTSKSEMRSFLVGVKDLVTLRRRDAEKQSRITSAFDKVSTFAMTGVSLSPAARDRRWFLVLAKHVWDLRSSFAEAVGHSTWMYMSDYFDTWTSRHRGEIPSNADFLAGKLKSPKPKAKSLPKAKTQAKAPDTKTKKTKQGFQADTE